MSNAKFIRNMFVDPVPAGGTAWSMDNGNNPGTKPTHSFGNGQLLIQGHTTSGNSYVLFRVPTMPAGDCVVTFNAKSGSSPTFFANRLLSVMDTNWKSFGSVPASMLNSRAAFRFLNPVEQRIIFAFQAPNNEARVAFEKLLLCTADDYARLQEQGIEWFSGDTYTS